MATIDHRSSPRFITYCTSHTADKSEKQNPPSFKEWISMLRLTEHGQKVTHINLGQWWWAPERSEETLFLNDTAWNEPSGDSTTLNGRIYQEVKQLQAHGVKVLAQLTFFWTEKGFGKDGPFNEHLYGLLKTMLTKSGFDGVDLDVEAYCPGDAKATDNAKVIAVIKRLKKDFGSKFLVTMAPGGNELTNGSANGNLSSVCYPELYKEIGDHIDWFNVQLYNGWGELTLANFEEYVKAGTPNKVYPAHKIVMNVCSNNENGNPMTPGEKIRENLPKILGAHPDMGGICCWEYYNAVLVQPPPCTTILHPEQWFRFVYRLLHHP